MRRILLCTALILSAAAFAAAPPDRMHYQGVLRDASGEPLDGGRDMVFKFFTTETLGDEMLVDRHVAANGQDVQISGGMFSVDLGGGELLDGSGPGSYSSLAEVFASHGEVWLEIEVGSETLAPRMRVMASAFALNAGSLDGRPAADFLDNSAGEQGKSGKLVVGQLAGTPDPYGLEAYGSEGGGYFEDTDQSGVAYTAWGDYGVLGYGGLSGGFFRDESNTDTYAHVGSQGYGIMGYGYFAGGYFKDSDHSGVANIGYNDYGVWATGDFMGGFFRDSDQSGYARVGYEDEGIQAYGANAGGYFASQNNSAYTWVGHLANGITAYGSSKGGYFGDTDGSGYANVAYGDYGIKAYGNTMGGYFQDRDSTGYAQVGSAGYGILGYGATMGGYFKDSDNSGYANVGDGDHGIRAFGDTMGGYFDDLSGTGFAYVAFGEWGLYGYGNSGGVQGVDLNSGTVAYLGTGSSSTAGNGAKNFIQNHPYRDDQVIVYAAPEGNEVATYTRGTARISNGEARIALDETFAWVTNPDIGLTAHLTPRTDGAALYVADLSTRELVVRASAGAVEDATFDYMIWGLRIGFEEVTVVREKGPFESYIPSMEEERSRLDRHPDLRKHVALDRFEAMHVALGRDAEIDLTGGKRLRDAVGTFDPAVHRLARASAASEQPVAPVTDERPPAAAVDPDASAALRADDEPTAEIRDEIAPERNTARRADVTRLPVAAPVAAGDLLVMDDTGRLTIGLDEADPGVVGVAAEDSVSIDGAPLVTLASSGIVTLKVDADLGAVERGDLLISSPTPGHAMRAYASIPGTVIAKALEPLASGRGTIRVVVTLR